MNVNSELLPKLICIRCKLYLTNFPIYLNPSGGSLCSRCTEPNNNFIRNEVYEHLASNQKFPCCYDVNGCLEKLLPKEIPAHEELCYYRKLICPAIVAPSCDWNGFEKNLLEHFEQKHQMLLLKDGRFEIDFVNSHQENYLLPYGEEFFIVHTATYSKMNTFNCTVKHIRNYDYNLYNYKIIMESGNKSKSHEISNILGKAIEINSINLRTILNDPISIIAQIEIFQNLDTSNENEDSFVSNIDYNMLREVECMVCLEYMIPPIYQCITGHSICLQCKKNLTKCPTCKKEFQDTQNFALGQLINHLIYPCKNEKCTFSTKSKDIKEHEATCKYSSVSCPLSDYSDCKEKFIFSDIYEHIRNMHYENLLETGTVTMPFDHEGSGSIEDCYIIRYHTKIFKLHFMFDESSSEFLWSMQLIGPESECEKYKFEIDIIDTSGNNRRVYSKTNCCALSDKSSFLNNERICLMYDQISRLITNKLSYDVRVFEE